MSPFPPPSYMLYILHTNTHIYQTVGKYLPTNCKYVFVIMIIICVLRCKRLLLSMENVVRVVIIYRYRRYLRAAEHGTFYKYTIVLFLDFEKPLQARHTQRRAFVFFRCISHYNIGLRYHHAGIIRTHFSSDGTNLVLRTVTKTDGKHYNIAEEKHWVTFQRMAYVYNIS